MKYKNEQRKSAEARDLGTDVHPAYGYKLHGRTVFIVPAMTGLGDKNVKKSNGRFARVRTVARIQIDGNKACPSCLIIWAADVEKRRARRKR